MIEKIVNEFVPRFVTSGIPLLVGDTVKNLDIMIKKDLKKLGISSSPHGKIPDVIIHDTQKKWLLVIKAVTSHGPIEPKRQAELKKNLVKIEDRDSFSNDISR